MVNSRQKGKRGELDWRDVLRKHGYPNARRGQQFSGTETTEDVVGGPVGFHCEVKDRKAHNVWNAMQQAEHDSGGRAVPYVAMRSPRKPWLVVLRAEDFLALLAKLPVARGAGDLGDADRPL